MGDFQGTTHTTTTHTVVISGPQFQFNPVFVRTWPGIFTIVEIILAIIVLICVGSTVGFAGTGFVLFTAIVALLIGLVRLTVYLLSLPSQAERFPWMLTYLIVFGIWAAFYFISGAICIAHADSCSRLVYRNLLYGNCQGGYGAGAFFCWVAAVLYGVHAFFFFQSWRAKATTNEVIGPVGIVAQPATVHA